MPPWETTSLGLHDLVERHDPRAGADGPAVHRARRLSVRRALDHRRQARAPPARPSPQPADPHRSSASPASRRTACCGSRAATTSSRPSSICRSRRITWFMRFAVFIGPVIAFIIARRWAISLQRHDRDLLLHGYETGVIVRSPDGGVQRDPRPDQPRARLHADRPTSAGTRRSSCRPARTRTASPHRKPGMDAAARPAVAVLVRRRDPEADGRTSSRRPRTTTTGDAPAHRGRPPRGIETGGQVGGDEFELEDSATGTTESSMPVGGPSQRSSRARQRSTCRSAPVVARPSVQADVGPVPSGRQSGARDQQVRCRRPGLRLEWLES